MIFRRKGVAFSEVEIKTNLRINCRQTNVVTSLWAARWEGGVRKGQGASTAACAKPVARLSN